MTNNKHKEIKQIVRSRYSIGGEFHEDGRSGLCITYEQLEETEKELRNFLSSALTEQLEELEKVLEKVKIKGYHNKENIEKAKFLQELYDEHIKPVILSHIREKKEIIKNNKN